MSNGVPRRKRNFASVRNTGIIQAPKARFFGRPSASTAAAEDRRREVEVDLEVAVELVAELLFELAVGEQPRDFVLVLVGEQLGVVDRDRARQRVAIAAIAAASRTCLTRLAVALGEPCVLIVGQEARCDGR